MTQRHLLDKIISGKYKAPPGIKKDLIQYYLPQAVAVDVTNVCDWQVETEKQWQDMITLMPHRLPFPAMWFEWVIEVEHEDQTVTSGFVGVLAVETPAEAESKDDFFDKEKLKDIRITTINFFHDNASQLTMASGGGEFTADFNDFNIYERLQTKGVFTNEKEALPSYCHQALQVLVPSLVFFACRNVEVRRMEPSNKKKKKYDRQGLTAPVFHVIEVHKKTVRNVYEGGVSNGSSVMHARVIAGHHKRYTPDAPLFGKVSGIWFWESHVRGSIGTPIVNDYKVYEPRHKGECKTQ